MVSRPKKARPTTYKGIEMRSRLEAGYAQFLDGILCEWEYEPQAFADPRGQYLPDFLIKNVERVGAGYCDMYVEVKPSYDSFNSADLLERMLIIRSSDPGAGLMLEVPGHHPVIAFPTFSEPAHIWKQVYWVLGSGSEDGGGTFALALPVPPAWAPWPEGYWNGPS